MLTLVLALVLVLVLLRQPLHYVPAKNLPHCIITQSAPQAASHLFHDRVQRAPRHLGVLQHVADSAVPGNVSTTQLSPRPLCPSERPLGKFQFRDLTVKNSVREL